MRLRLVRFALFAAILAAVVLAACGLPGAPQPPSLRLPQPVDDLVAWRKGDVVYLSWSPPRSTTDGQTLRRLGRTEVCRAVAVAVPEECLVLRVLPGASLESLPETISVTDRLAPELQRQHPTGFAAYAVRVFNERGRAAALSNQMQAPLASTLPPPQDLRAEVTAEGVRLSWSGMLHEHDAPELRHVYRVYRQTGSDDASAEGETVVGEVQLAASEKASLLDPNIEWGQQYRYLVAAVTVIAPPSSDEVSVEGEDSEPLAVTPVDTFPPQTPTAVEAIFAEPGGFIDVIWNPSLDADLAGYNVYRSREGGREEQRNGELMRTPFFRDSEVQPGNRYSYSISAVDSRGNESARSRAAEETVPRN